MGKTDLLAITVNRHESRALLNAFESAVGHAARPVPLDDRVYRELGTINGTTVYHALSEMGTSGPGATLQTADKGIRALAPNAVVAVGIAFGVDESKQAIGDILLSHKLSLYELQRAGQAIVPRGDRPHASSRLINFFEGVAQTSWSGAEVRPGVLLTGEKLIDDVDYRNQLLAFESEAVGGEMEGAGLYVACQDHNVDWIVIKAICDWADGNKSRNKSENQKTAAENAAAFLLFSLQHASLRAMYGQSSRQEVSVPPVAPTERFLARKPKAFYTRPYSLLQTEDIVGRKRELEELRKFGQSSDAVTCVVSIGGMGKSALSWKWFDSFANQDIDDLEGMIWWSFYDADSSFSKFVAHALAYVTDRAFGECHDSVSVQLDRLLTILSQHTYLIVFDGFERELRAYSTLEEGRTELPEKPLTDCRCADHRVADFLSRMRLQNRSKLILSSRLVPDELTTVSGKPAPRTSILNLSGLAIDDGLKLWNELGIHGTASKVKSFFKLFDGHPLLIQALGREIAMCREAPCDFDMWAKLNPDFDPFSLPLNQRKSHILHFATRRLPQHDQRVLQSIAHFRSHANYQPLCEILVGTRSLFESRERLSESLAQLEKRGLVSWDRDTNTYDMHPVIRGFVWNMASESEHRDYYESIEKHFAALPDVTSNEISTEKQLSPAIELFNALIRTKKFGEAYMLFARRLKSPLRKLVAAQLTQRLLWEFFDSRNDLDSCRLREPSYQTPILRHLANTHLVSGEPQVGLEILKHALGIVNKTRDAVSCVILRGQIAIVCCVLGRLKEASEALDWNTNYFIDDFMWRGFDSSLAAERRTSVQCEHEIWSGFLESIRGNDRSAEFDISRGIKIGRESEMRGYVALGHSIRARHRLWCGRFEEAKQDALVAEEISKEHGRKRDLVQSMALLSRTHAHLGDSAEALSYGNKSMKTARECEYVSGEFAAVAALAFALQAQGDTEDALQIVESYLERIADSGYLLEEVDLLLTKSMCLKSRGNIELAITSAKQARERSRCDGEQNVFAWGLESSESIIDAF